MEGRNVQVDVDVSELEGLVSWIQNGEFNDLILTDIPDEDKIGSYEIEVTLEESDLSLTETFSIEFEILSPEEAELQEELQAI